LADNDYEFLSGVDTFSAMKTFITFLISIMTTTTFANGPKTPPIVFAWINSLQEIELIVDSPASVDSRGLQVLDTSNNSLEFEIARRTNDSVVLKLNNKMNPEKNYLVKTSSQEIFGYYSLATVESEFNYQGPLGVELSSNKSKADFKLWSPSAEKVSVVVYSKDLKVLFTRDLARKAKGLWEVTVSDKGNLEGLLYQYKIHAFGKDSLALDPYAKSMGAFNPRSNESIGMGVIVLPAKKKQYQPPKTQKDDANFVGMEVQVRDITSSPDSPAPASLKGTYLGLISALDSFKDLGVTHLQLQPLQNFYTVDESKRNFHDRNAPRSDLNYNWGYDPHNYFTPEGWYSTDASNPYARITELQKMSDEIHARGMGIILDVVYNHVYHGEAFEGSAPGLYLRRNRRGEVSHGTGAGATVESRSVMVRKLIIDSMKYWQDTFQIDGFRFDLLGFMDKESLTQIRKALHPDTVLYGEAWVFTDLPHSDAVIKTDLPHSLNISAFNDTSRDAFAGRNEGWGFVQGHFHDHQKVRAGIVGGVRNHPQRHLVSQSDYDTFAESPLEALNYLTIHDGFTLWDKINLSIGGDKARRMQIAKNAYSLLFTSQGRVIFHQGCEAGRSKPLYPNDPNPDRAHTSGVAQSENGIKHFHENSYASSDETNAFNWTRALEFSELRNYVKGLISLRKALPGLRFNEAQSVQNGVKFIENTGNGLIAYFIDNTLEKENGPLSSVERILVVHNAEEISRELWIPDIQSAQDWKILVDCKTAGITPITNSSVFVDVAKVVLPGKCSAVIVKGSVR
jgi:pullulanase